MHVVLCLSDAIFSFIKEYKLWAKLLKTKMGLRSDFYLSFNSFSLVYSVFEFLRPRLLNPSIPDWLTFQSLRLLSCSMLSFKFSLQVTVSSVNTLLKVSHPKQGFNMRWDLRGIPLLLPLAAEFLSSVFSCKLGFFFWNVLEIPLFFPLLSYVWGKLGVSYS